ncbi:MAG TPA: phage baseplate assembly protein V [Bryobacteraceae bacterium]|nr:phage baseplate assembly protein V [Bryobacteraceae bacterium]
MIEETLLEPATDEGFKKYYGVTVGRVINMLDPLAIGRLQVQLPFIDSLDLAPWARVCVPMAGMLSGAYYIPNIGDEVLVAFEHGDARAPYILGSLWNVIERPPLPSPVPQIRTTRTLVGNQIVFTELPPTVTIQNGPTSPIPIPSPPIPTGPYQTIQLSPAGCVVGAMQIQMLAATMMQVTVGSTMVTITPAGVEITSAGTLDLTAAGAINITAGGVCSIQAPLVKIN